MLTTTQKRVLTAGGYNHQLMTAGECDAALIELAGAAINTIATPFAPAADAPTAEMDAPTFDEMFPPKIDVDGFVDTFMMKGVDAFKQSLSTHLSALKTDADGTLRVLEIAQDQLAAELAKPRGRSRVIVKAVDAAGVSINSTALSDRPAAALFNLDDDDGLTVYASDDAAQAPEYDFNTVAKNGVLAHVAVCQATQNHIWLAGPKGTGKTTFAQAYAKATGRPFHRISHMKQMECQDLIGSRIFDSTGAMIWADGQLTLALRDPNAVILLDEPSLNPAACEMYQTVLDEGYLTIPATGERVALSPDHLVIAADNTAGDGDMSGGYHGTAPLNEAFVDRFAFIVKMEYMTIAAETALLTRYCGADNATQIATYAAAIRTACADGQVLEPISFRRLEALATLIGSGIPALNALTTAVFNHVRNETDEEFYRLKAGAVLDFGGAA